MTKDHPNPDELWKEAFDLLIRHQETHENPVTQSMISGWVGRSELHAKIWQEALKLHDLTGRALPERSHASQKVQPTRRRFLIGGGLAIAGLAGVSVAPHISLLMRSDILTQTAEVRTHLLPDDSKVTLGPYSALDIDFTESRRSIELLTGMAYFDVEAVDNFPFTLKAGGAVVDVSNSSAKLELNREDGFWSVAIEQGLVNVSTSNQSVDLQNMQWASQDKASKEMMIADKSSTDFASWQKGRIFVENEPIHAVLSRLSRWHNSKILIADAQLGNMPIAGVFNTNDLLSAAAAVVKPYGAKARQVSPWVTIISRV